MEQNQKKYKCEKRKSSHTKKEVPYGILEYDFKKKDVVDLQERKIKYRRFLWAVLFFSILGMAGMCFKLARQRIPDEVHIYKNRKTDWEAIFDDPLVDYEIVLETSQNGVCQVNCRWLGFLPLKTVKVSPIEENYLYVSGTPIGIYMETNGVMIAGCGEVSDEKGNPCTPAKNLLQPGDYIQKINGIKLKNKKQLVQLVKDSEGRPVKIELLRGKEPVTVEILPRKTDQGEYKLGIWVRDNIQGVGTLTFLDEEGNFGALGHGISDMDTGMQMDISGGNLYCAKIVSIRKGAAGQPGELQGVIDYSELFKIGEILSNTPFGIGGRAKGDYRNHIHRELCPMALKQEIHTGEAEIMCDIGEGVKKYAATITKLNWNMEDTNKSFVIQVTDSRLLKETGGIVQGMSGSPVLQDGRLVGAVTHVLVNDPTRGYGIFIENMLKTA